MTGWHGSVGILSVGVWRQKLASFTPCLLREPNIENFDLIKRMEKRFGLRDLPEASQMQFTYARQTPEETIPDWADRVLHLATKAFPGLPEHHIQKQIVLRFCQGCNDREAGQYAINTQPVNLEAAIDSVRWYQHTHRVIFGRAKRDVKQVPLLDGDIEDDIQVWKVNTTQCPDARPKLGRSTDQSPSNLEHRLASLEGKLDILQKSLEKLTTLPGRSV